MYTTTCKIYSCWVKLDPAFAYAEPPSRSQCEELRPLRSCYVTQGAQPGVLWWSRERWDEGERREDQEGVYICIILAFCIVMQEKPSQHCKAAFLQLKNKNAWLLWIYAFIHLVYYWINILWWCDSNIILLIIFCFIYSKIKYKNINFN